MASCRDVAFDLSQVLFDSIEVGLERVLLWGVVSQQRIEKLQVDAHGRPPWLLNLFLRFITRSRNCEANCEVRKLAVIEIQLLSKNLCASCRSGAAALGGSVGCNFLVRGRPIGVELLTRVSAAMRR